MSDSDARAHWTQVYANKRANEVSWFQERPEVSLTLIRRIGLAHDAAVIDIGAGASTLLDGLLDQEFTDLSALDIADAAFAQTKARLGARADAVSWIVSDVTAWAPMRAYQLWHDRAVLHFLTEPAQQGAYAQAALRAVAPAGWAIIAGFAPGGPVKCSGLPIVQHDGESLERLLGAGFRLRETHGETHVTPGGATQAFRYHVFERI